MKVEKRRVAHVSRGVTEGQNPGLSHVDFGVKATIQSADEASAREEKGVTADEQ